VTDADLSVPFVLFGKPFQWHRRDAAAPRPRNLFLRPAQVEEGDQVRVPYPWTRSPCAEWNAVQRLQAIADRAEQEHRAEQAALGADCHTPVAPSTVTP
jgi:hypothetical protein